MTITTAPIIHATEKLYTLIKRAAISSNRDDHHDAIIAAFKVMCTDLGKIATRFKPTDWTRVHLSIVDLHSAAVHAEEMRAGTFSLMGTEMALVTTLSGLAANLGFIIEDAATAPHVFADPIDAPADEAAMAAVEGVDVVREAAE